ncbi:MAG: hypothetical protein WD066_19405 [Planctomycetaceae bacterium]
MTCFRDPGIRVSFALFAAHAFAAISGCGGGAEDAAIVTFVCTETRAVIRAAAQPTPAVHPETGRRTLVRGMYCAKCDAWFPVPTDARHPEAIRCRKHGEPMSLTGPEAASTGSSPGGPPASSEGG